MKVLVIGLGSIGSRHYENFKSLGCEVSVVSKRPQAFPSFFSVSEAFENFQPSHIVISNETSAHETTLNEVLMYTSVEKVLVEKPLYAHVPNEILVSDTSKVVVAYNLRFHPMIQQLKHVIQNKKIIGAHFYVGQDLSMWRPNRDYRNVYSSKKMEGGGVLRDLSHEFDLFQFFFGKLKLVASYGGHFSKLESDVEDTYTVIVSSSDCPSGIIHMNCVDKIGQRFIIIHAEDESYHLDLVTGLWKESKIETKFNFDKNESYLKMSRAFLNGDKSLCSFQGGLAINHLIKIIEEKA